MRRTIDILVSFIVLLALSPLLLLIAIAIVLDSPGGPLYLARRIGTGGRTFRMWKFRSMTTGSARSGAITGRNDPRVTRIGRVLRRTKLDELPQFVNVLLGDMTLVGPRPEAPEIVAHYSSSQRAVLAAKPGITGCVQLSAGCEADNIPAGATAEEFYVRHLMAGKVQRDIEYLKTRTPWSDARVILASAAYIARALIQPRDGAAQTTFGGRSWI